MTTATDKKILTPAEYREEGLRVRQVLTSYPLCLDATIDDYPIGRSDRGKCRLQVERAKGKGYRTVRTTTDRNGVWCKPKKSTFGNAVRCVITGLGGDRDIRWLGVSETAVWLSSANGESDTLLKAPHYCKPSRTDRAYTVTTTRIVDLATMEGEAKGVERNVIPADPPELCDSWDAWYEEYRVLRAIAIEAWAGK